MRDDYGTVLADLRAKRAALDELIAALENVSRLSSPIAAPEISRAPKAGKRLASPRLASPRLASPRLASPRLARSVPPRAKAKPLRRATGDTSEDDIRRRVVAWVAQEKRGLRLAEIASGVGANPNSLKTHLVQLVGERRLVRRGVRAGTRYWPAGTTAKEAL